MDIKTHAFHMKCALDKGRLMDALNHTSSFLGELRTSSLNPKEYYELFIAVTDQLRHLILYLSEEFDRGRKLADLYEVVQHAGNVIPRLYLLITVGHVYMVKSPNCRKDILKDLVEMCGGVQHPLRGLFLRHYLLQMCKDILPANNSNPSEGTLQDSLDFILTNFAEMNKLWVRIQHQGHSREKDKKEKERQDLRILVGTNLVRLSQLDGLDIECYKETVLPSVLEQIVSSRDAIAQEYLMECLIQVFPDEFHLVTMQPFFNSCATLMNRVNVRNIIVAFVHKFSGSNLSAPQPEQLYEEVSTHVEQLVENRQEINVEDVVAIKTALIKFALDKLPEDVADKKIQQSFLSCLQFVTDHADKKNSALNKELVDLLMLPIGGERRDELLKFMAKLKESNIIES